MNSCQIWIDIVIPLICALIGGMLTFFGVLYTIKKQTKKEKKEEKLKYKPYLKISHNKCGQEICLQRYIIGMLEPENINSEKFKYYSFILEDFSILNSSNAECLLREIVIDNKKYPFHETLLLKNEQAIIITTRNSYVNISKLLKEIYLTASDSLGNLYYYKCEFIEKPNGFLSVIEDDNKQKSTIYTLTYKIVNISLPQETLK